MALKRPVASGARPGGPGQWDGGAFGKSHPELWEMLADDAYEDGTSRKTSTLTVFVEGGQLKLCLSDRDNGRVCWVTGLDLTDALAALSAALSGGTADWRVSTAGATRRKGA